VKGGAAWIHNKWDLSNAPSTNEELFPLGPLLDATRTGWTIGGGAEWTLWSPNWTAFVEYNFYDFDDSNLTQAVTCHSSSHAPCFNQLTQGRQTINAVKVGVNYKWW
jgi:outer membrane immunogenic protein